jgi:Putative transposase of IS4/5 family (DUF4096)
VMVGAGRAEGATAIVDVLDDLWARIEPLLPVIPRRPDHPGRRRLDDRKVLCGILFALYTAIPWELLPQEPGSRSRCRTGSGGCASAGRSATTSMRLSSASPAPSSAGGDAAETLA